MEEDVTFALLMTTLAADNLKLSINNRQILQIALPISLALLVPQINFVANTIFLSHLGETELGAAGITGVFYLVFALVGNGLNSGLQSLIARRAGEGRPLEIGKLFSQSLWIAMMLAVVSIAIVFLFGPWFLRYALHIPLVEQESISFLRIRVLGLPFLYLFQTGNALLVGTNNSKYMKYGFAVEAGINILLDYVLINGKWGFPMLGFNGAAIASVIAEVTGCLIVFLIIHYKNFNNQFGLFTSIKFNRQLSGLLFKQSSPLILQFVISVGAWLIFYVLIENSGRGQMKERPLAISNTMRNIFSVFGVFIWAFASTANAMVSNIIGQNRKDEVMSLIKRIAILSVLITFSLCILINLFPDLLLGIYGRDQEFINAAIPVLRMVSLSLLLMAIGTVWLNGVTGTGNTRINLLIEIMAVSIYGIYIILVIRVWELSLMWAWAAELLYWGAMFTGAYLYIRSNKWRARVI